MLHCAISCAPHHSYYDPATLSLDLEGMLADLCAAPSGSVILLHACAHNPTGVSAPACLLAGGRTGVLAGGRACLLRKHRHYLIYALPLITGSKSLRIPGIDPTVDQWQRILSTMQARGHIAFFDSAYQGFASGDADADAAAVRMVLL